MARIGNESELLSSEQRTAAEVLFGTSLVASVAQLVLKRIPHRSKLMPVTWSTALLSGAAVAVDTVPRTTDDTPLHVDLNGHEILNSYLEIVKEADVDGIRSAYQMRFPSRNPPANDLREFFIGEHRKVLATLRVDREFNGGDFVPDAKQFDKDKVRWHLQRNGAEADERRFSELEKTLLIQDICAPGMEAIRHISPLRLSLPPLWEVEPIVIHPGTMEMVVDGNIRHVICTMTLEVRSVEDGVAVAKFRFTTGRKFTMREGFALADSQVTLLLEPFRE